MRASDLAFLTGPLIVGMGAGAVRKYRQCGTPSRLQPPGYVFAVAWTILYALYGVALYLAWTQGSRVWTPALKLATVTLGLMVAWSLVFLWICAPVYAFAGVVGLLGLVVATAVAFFRGGQRTSAALMVPLTLWLAFASYLSFATI